MHLTDYQKYKQIPDAIKEYIAEKNTSQAGVGRLAGVSESYISHIVAGKTHISKSKIKDRYYEAVAKAIGFPLKKEVWRHFDTYNFMQISNALQKAKEEQIRICIDGDTGAGKSYSCHQFKKLHPNETFVVTASALENKKEFCINIAETVEVETHGTAAAIIKRVIKKLTKSFKRPLLIIDEAEHIGNKQGYINVIKSLSDALENQCGLVIVGMDINKILQRGYDRHRQNFRQTARRFANREQLSKDIKEDIRLICENMGITKKGIQNWFCNRVQNFGDLEIMIKEAFGEREKSNQPINMEMLNSLFI